MSEREKSLLILAGVLGLTMIIFISPPLSASGTRYKKLFENAEQKHGLPKSLLSRVAYQESHFRPDIINGQTISKAGAVGIMQIIPRWHPTVDPLNVNEAIPYAAKYLKSLYNRFGTWRQALGAYNWGPGNMEEYLSGKKRMPTETKNYISQISTDVFKV